jgi:NAD(P)-dependent dehydrogenase (short-subunit alcohol dehydrogenase family)
LRIILEKRPRVKYFVLAPLHPDQIDVVFNNAGIMPTRDLCDCAEATWDDVMAVNVLSMYLMYKAVIAHMLTRGGGTIINTSSVMATLTEPGYEAYTTSKAAVIGLTKAAAVSYADRGHSLQLYLSRVGRHTASSAAGQRAWRRGSGDGQPGDLLPPLPRIRSRCGQHRPTPRPMARRSE